ncbi:MAG TPA: HAD-IA family hydrolase [Dissulfurispiraceae bacterium]|nr:HAD-IA family hydrolase [Dissulfurispiraceae bacterium]
MSIQLIIFDLDGTLVDSSHDIRTAINFAIEPYGARPITVEETRELVGEGITVLMEKVMALESLDVDREILVNRFLSYYSEHLIELTSVYAGVAETLTGLSRFRKAVVSNKREDLSLRTLRELGLSAHFELVVGSETAAAKKPSPIPIYYVLEKMALLPENAVIVGDSTYDVEAGRNAGIRTVAVTYGYRPAELLRDADALIDSMTELPELLKKWEARRGI